MKTYIVLYEAFEGATQAFGPFDSFEKAETWMGEDLKYNVDLYKKETEKDADYWIAEKSRGIENYGEWQICELERP